MTSMPIYQSSKAMPYVYLCTHRTTHEFYYGSRYQNVRLNRPSHIDLPLYRTSSKIVKPIFDQFDWIIVAEFMEVASAIELEHQLIHEHWADPRILNQACYAAFNGKLPWPEGRNHIPKPKKEPKLPRWMRDDYDIKPTQKRKIKNLQVLRPYLKVVTDNITWESHGEPLLEVWHR